MAKIDELKTEVAALNTSFSAELAAIKAKLEAIPSGTSDADIDGVIADLTTLQGKIDAETTALTGVEVPPPPPSGPPVG